MVEFVPVNESLFQGRQALLIDWNQYGPDRTLTESGNEGYVYGIGIPKAHAGDPKGTVLHFQVEGGGVIQEWKVQLADDPPPGVVSEPPTPSGQPASRPAGSPPATATAPPPADQNIPLPPKYLTFGKAKPNALVPDHPADDAVIPSKPLAPPGITSQEYAAGADSLARETADHVAAARGHREDFWRASDHSGNMSEVISDPAHPERGPENIVDFEGNGTTINAAAHFGPDGSMQQFSFGRSDFNPNGTGAVPVTETWYDAAWRQIWTTENIPNSVTIERAWGRTDDGLLYIMQQAATGPDGQPVRGVFDEALGLPSAARPLPSLSGEVYNDATRDKLLQRIDAEKPGADRGNAAFLHDYADSPLAEAGYRPAPLPLAPAGTRPATDFEVATATHEVARGPSTAYGHVGGESIQPVVTMTDPTLARAAGVLDNNQPPGSINFGSARQMRDMDIQFENQFRQPQQAPSPSPSPSPAESTGAKQAEHLGVSYDTANLGKITVLTLENDMYSAHRDFATQGYVSKQTAATLVHDTALYNAQRIALHWQAEKAEHVTAADHPKLAAAATRMAQELVPVMVHDLLDPTTLSQDIVAAYGRADLWMA